MMRISHLNALRALEASLRTGSFTAAADELGVTPAAVGQQVRTLEAYLGVRLFRRTQRGVVPSAEARSVADRLTASFSSLSDVLGTLGARKSDRRVAVTLPASFAEHWLAHRVHDFYRVCSDVDLRLDATNRMVDLYAEDFDFALRYSPPAEDGLDEIELFGDYVLPVCSPAFAGRYRLSALTRSLDGVPIVHLDNRTPDPAWADWAGWGARFGFASEHLREGIHFTRAGSGLQSALSDQGLVLSGLVEAFEALRAGQLVAPFGPELRYPTSYRYRLVWVRHRSLTERQGSFVHWMRDASSKFSSEMLEFLKFEVRP